jgi:hypothetical protein
MLPRVQSGSEWAPVYSVQAGVGPWAVVGEVVRRPGERCLLLRWEEPIGGAGKTLRVCG